MDSGASGSVIRAQICLYLGLVIAILLKPHGLAADSGISFYGIYLRTVIPFAFGLLGSAFCYLRAALSIRRQDLRPLRFALVAAVALTIVIAATPYSVSSLFDWLHTSAGSALFSLQLLLSGWLIVHLRYARIIVLLTAIELLAGIACAYYLHGSQGFLIQFQILFQIAFGALLIYSLHRLEATAHSFRSS